MRAQLPNEIRSLSRGLDVSATSLLQEIKLSKEIIPELSNALEEISISQEIASAPIAGTVDANSLARAFQDMISNVDELYSVNNLISNLLSSTREIMRSELKGLEDDLKVLDKQVSSHYFLPGTHNGYSGSFLEDFSGDLGRERINSCEDRTADPFGPPHVATVDLNEGALVLPGTRHLTDGSSMDMKVVSSNVGAQVHGPSTESWYETGEGYWRVSVNADSPITRSIPEAEGLTGAQVVLDVKAQEGVVASSVTIEPFSDLPMELVGARLYGEDGANEGIEIIDRPMRLDSVRTLYFPLQSVSKVRLTLCQPTYTRVSTMSTMEDAYKEAYDELRRRISNLRRSNTFNTEPGMKRLMYFLVDFFNLGVKHEMVEASYRAAMNLYENTPPSNRVYDQPGGISYTSTLVSHVMEALKPYSPYTPTVRVRGNRARAMKHFDIIKYYEQMLSKGSEIYNTLALREIRDFEDESNWGMYNDPDGVLSPLEVIHSSGWTYKYSLGLYNVKLGVRSSNHKGFFISKPIDVEGDIGEVSMRVDDWNYRADHLGRDDSMLTSIEYSVSNVSMPTRESDWIPIIPYNQTLIESERLLPNDLGKAMFRFPAIASNTITIYRNGTTLEVPTNRFIMDAGNVAYIGVNMSFEEISPSDIFTVSYSPHRESEVVNFAESGFADSTLTNASDNYGSGETFTSTHGRREITLLNYPYIYEDKLDSTSYSPVWVRLSDGTFATNMTDYSGGMDGVVPPEGDGVYFTHSGKNIIFSKPLDERFTVLYQYMRGNVRFRAVLRSNGEDIVTPKVHSVQLKVKTKRPNVRGIF